MKKLVTDSVKNPKYKKQKVRALNQNLQTIKLIPSVQDAATFFGVSNQTIGRTIDNEKILQKDGNSYRLERYS